MIDFDVPADDARRQKIAAFDKKLAQVPAGAKLVNPRRTNVHPADELAALREQHSALAKRIDALRDQLMADGADLSGDEYVAVLVPSVRETLDRKAITEAYGEKAIAPFIKKTAFKTVKLEKK
jgi:hypothetical protein